MRGLFHFLILCPHLVFAEDTKILSNQILSVESGVICAPVATGEAKAPDTLAGTTHLISENPPFVSQENQVPAVLGIGFGVKSMSIYPDGLSDVQMVITHPPMGVQKTTSQSYKTTISGRSQSITFYQFDFDYELQIGTWRMEAIRGEEILFSAEFEIVLPNQMPELSQVCGFEDLLSLYFEPDASLR